MRSCCAMAYKIRKFFSPCAQFPICTIVKPHDHSSMDVIFLLITTVDVASVLFVIGEGRWGLSSVSATLDKDVLGDWDMFHLVISMSTQPQAFLCTASHLWSWHAFEQYQTILHCEHRSGLILVFASMPSWPLSNFFSSSFSSWSFAFPSQCDANDAAQLAQNTGAVAAERKVRVPPSLVNTKLSYSFMV